MFRLLLQWGLSALSLMLVARLVPGVHVKHFGTALAAAAVYGILHVLLYKLLVIIAFIPMLLTFGLFVFVINAFLLFLTDKLLADFHIDSLPRTLVVAVLLTILNGLWRMLLF
ncbi:MAG: putative membrane protein YvlD [Candidatus Tectimicrobiota bacterium]|nr:MAG: putative membrane protein YvlD [Candidatus Tectomicrobia bacterium]